MAARLAFGCNPRHLFSHSFFKTADYPSGTFVTFSRHLTSPPPQLFTLNCPAMAAPGIWRTRAALHPVAPRLHSLCIKHFATVIAGLRSAPSAGAPRPALPPPLLHRPLVLQHQQQQRRGVSCRSYASPEVYDIAFSFRDFEAEVAFLMEVYQTHCTGPLARFLDVG